jgi:hypothetical protein
MNKTYPILYSRDSKGKIRIWEMEQNNERYRTISGLEDGEKVTSEWSIATAKNTGKSNETSDIEQATAEIEYKYKKQLKSDYFEDIKDIDQIRFIQPMLAKGFLDRLDKIVYPVIVDIKYNGGRIITQKSGQFSRKGEKYQSVPHLYESVEFLFKKHATLFLDGEGYNHDYRFKLNEIMKLLRKTVHITNDDLRDSKNRIQYYVYDGYGWDNINKETKQFERRAALIKLLKDIPYIIPVKGKIAENEKDVWKIYEEYTSEGYEGAIVRLDEPYQHKRSSALLKLKPENDSEGIIQDILEGEGNWSKTGKVIVLKWKDKIFNATFKGTYEEAAQFLKDKNKWVNKEVTFLYNGLTGLGVPNFARVDINNCIKK